MTLTCHQVISKQHPNSLLILDDVWSAEVAAAFSVRCRVMVTSRNAAVAERVTAAEVYDVSVSQGGSTFLRQFLLKRELPNPQVSTRMMLRSYWHNYCVRRPPPSLPMWTKNVWTLL